MGDIIGVSNGEQQMQKKMHILNLSHKNTNHHRTTSCSFPNIELNALVAEQMVAEFG